MCGHVPLNLGESLPQDLQQKFDAAVSQIRLSKGAVVALSAGVDSSLVALLHVRRSAIMRLQLLESLNRSLHMNWRSPRRLRRKSESSTWLCRPTNFRIPSTPRIAPTGATIAKILSTGSYGASRTV